MKQTFVFVYLFLISSIPQAKETLLTSDGLLSLGGAYGVKNRDEKAVGLTNLWLEIRSKNRDPLHIFIGSENKFGYGASLKKTSSAIGLFDCFPGGGVDLALPRLSPISIIFKPKIGYGFTAIQNYIRNDKENFFYNPRFGVTVGLSLNQLSIAKSVLIEASYSRYFDDNGFQIVDGRLSYVPYDIYEASMGTGLSIVVNFIDNKNLYFLGGGLGITF